MQSKEPSIHTYDYDDDLIEIACSARERRWRVYRLTDMVVVLGRGSNPHTELQLDACVEDGVPLLRRRGGGCAVVVDPGNVIVSAVLPMNGIGSHREYFGRLSDWLICGLREVGVPSIRRAGVSDLAIQNRKIGGACIYGTKDFLYYSATLLVHPRIELMERYLKHPPREPEYRRGRSHSDFVGSLSGGQVREAERLAAALRAALNQIDLEKFISQETRPERQRGEGFSLPDVLLTNQEIVSKMDNPILSLLNARKAGRSISKEPLPENVIVELVEAIRLTPSCFNNQPWRFLFLESPEALAKGQEALTSANCVWASRAPLFVVGYSRREDDCVESDGRVYHQFDLGMSAMNLMLAATHHGLVARPMAGFEPEKIKQNFELGSDVQPLVMIAIGLPSDDERHLPERYKETDKRPRQRKEAAEIVTRL